MWMSISSAITIISFLLLWHNQIMSQIVAKNWQESITVDNTSMNPKCSIRENGTKVDLHYVYSSIIGLLIDFQNSVYINICIKIDDFLGVCPSFRKLLLGFLRYQAEIFCVDSYWPKDRLKLFCSIIRQILVFQIFFCLIFLQISST